MIFTFWTGGPVDQITLAGAPAEWKGVAPSFAALSDDEARTALRLITDDAVDLYDAITIPACRSDIARLALLYERGGLYIDAHTGTADPWCLASTLEKLSRYELLVFSPTATPGARYDIVNTALAAQRRSPLLKTIARRALFNLRAHRQAEEATDAYVPYNIAVLTGAGVLLSTLFRHSGIDYELIDSVAAQVEVVRIGPEYADLPFHFYKHYKYRKPDSHWSERQTRERLFKGS